MQDKILPKLREVTDEQVLDAMIGSTITMQKKGAFGWSAKPGGYTDVTAMGATAAECWNNAVINMRFYLESAPIPAPVTQPQSTPGQDILDKGPLKPGGNRSEGQTGPVL